MLDMRPFTYGLKLTTCYDEGTVYDAKLLNIGSKDVYSAFAAGVGNVAALSLALGFPTLPAFPHVVGAGFRNLLAISLATDYSFKQADALKARAAAGPVAPEPVKEDKKPEPAKKAEPAKPVEKDSTSDDGDFGDIFG